MKSGKKYCISSIALKIIRIMSNGIIRTDDCSGDESVGEGDDLSSVTYSCIRMRTVTMGKLMDF